MRILIADDDPLMCDLMESYVERCSHEVVAKIATGGLSVIRAFGETQPDAVMLDVIMPHCNGLTVFHALRSRQAKCPIILMSGMVAADSSRLAGCKPTAFLRKPMLLSDVQAALALCVAELEAKRVRDEAGEMEWAVAV